jgi:purine-nucleoside phosphorylase
VRAIHLRPAAELAERVLLPGDPGRALAVAKALLDEPRMYNHRRGLWGYTGLAPDGEKLTVQSTGMGGPSATIVTEELIALGAKRLVRIGTCGALDESLSLGELLAAEAVVPADGASAALSAPDPVRPDPELTGGLVRAGARPATVASVDLFYAPEADGELRLAARGALAVEMEAAAVLQVAALRGTAAACLLGVSDLPPDRRLADDELEALGIRLGEVGYAALAA